jgi:hypothetical protein
MSSGKIDLKMAWLTGAFDPQGFLRWSATIEGRKAMPVRRPS